MTTIAFPKPPDIFVDEKGMLTRPAFFFLVGLFNRVGGSNGPSMDDLSASLFEDAGTSEVWAALNTATQDAGQTPPVIPSPAFEDVLAEMRVVADQLSEFMKTDFPSEIRALRDQITELNKVVEGLQQSPAM